MIRLIKEMCFTKNTIKHLWIIAMVATVGFSMQSCNKDDDDITITVKGDFSEYSGWEANIALANDKNKAVAFAMPLNVRGTTSLLQFTMLKMDNNKPFNKSGAYTVIFWFEKNGEEDEDYVLLSKKINGGDNSIDFSAFTSL